MSKKGMKKIPHFQKSLIHKRLSGFKPSSSNEHT